MNSQLGVCCEFGVNQNDVNFWFCFGTDKKRRIYDQYGKDGLRNHEERAHASPTGFGFHEDPLLDETVRDVAHACHLIYNRLI